MFLAAMLVATSFNFAQWIKLSDVDLGATTKIASFNGAIFAYGDKVYKSTDKGTNWSDITANFPDDVYCIYNHNGDLLAISGINTIYSSEDLGDSWQLRGSVVLSGGNGAILNFETDGDLLYALSNRESIFRSSDNGKSWDELLIVVDGATNLLPLDFAVSANLIVVAASSLGAIISTDAGSTWAINNPESLIGQVVKHNGEIFGGTYGFYKLNSSGSWEVWKDGIPEGGGISYSVKGMISSGGKIFAAVSSLFNGYVYNSDNSGQNWVETDSGLPQYITTGSTNFLTVSEGELYAYMYGLSLFAPGFTGIYKTSVDVSTQLEEKNHLPEKFELFQNYPNPFNPSTTIGFNLPTNNYIVISVYNLTGELVASPYKGDLSAGYHSIRFDASELPSGTYFYSVYGAGFSESRKMLLVK